MTLPGFAPLVLPIIERAISGASYGGKYTDDAIHEGLNVDDILFSKYSPGVLRFLAENFPQLGVEANISVFSLTSSSWFSINTGALTWERYGQVEKYQGAEELPEAFWPSIGPTPSAHKVVVHILIKYHTYFKYIIGKIKITELIGLSIMCHLL